MVIGLVVIILIVAAVAVMALGGNKNDTQNNTTNAKSTPSAKSESSTSSSDTSSASATTSVDIKNFMFEPMAIKVKVGDTVTWTNQDGVKHNVVADSASADAPDGPLIAKGETYSFTFKKAGTYTYHCMPHTYMHGTVIVTE